MLTLLMGVTGTLAVLGCCTPVMLSDAMFRRVFRRNGCQGLMQCARRHDDTEDRRWLSALPCRTLTLRTDDGLTLSGRLYSLREHPRAVTLLAHGFCDDGTGMASYARLFLEETGEAVFLPHLRGHGGSEGHYIGFGIPDRDDLRQWLRLLLRELGEEMPIALFGVSMGASAVLMTADCLPCQVRCLIADCPYTSTEAILRHNLHQLLHLPSQPTLALVDLSCRLRAGYRLKDGDCTARVAQCPLPILLIHGEEDTFVPTSMAHTLYGAMQHDASQLMLFPHTGHGESLRRDPQHYREAVSSFWHRMMGL